MIVTEGLTKQYGQLTALSSLSMSIARGEVFGLLGPNGAGKTTTLRLLAGLVKPTAGSVRVAGYNPWTEPLAVRRRLGVVLERAGLYERLTVTENLALFARLYEVGRHRVETVLAETGLTAQQRQRAGTLSKGQRQRLGLARALLAEPDILFLDEPTDGLDPVAAANFQALLQQQQAAGVTIVLCSHDMAEVERLCDRIAFLDHGRLIACDTVESLKRQFGRPVVKATLATAGRTETGECDLAAPELPETLAGWAQSGQLVALHTVEASLADIFAQLTGRESA